MQADARFKSIERVIRDIPQHWVGDGFSVRSLFSYADGNRYDPFLLLDYAGPHRFASAELTRGVGEHPHRGFETVTIVYQGEPVVGQGPFVMNTREEIQQAISDYRNGRMGHLA